MFTRTLPPAAFFLGLLMLAGCTSAPKLERVGVQITEVTPSVAGTTMVLRFINPNNVPLVVPESEHALYLGGNFMGVIKNHRPLGIPPLRTAEESLPLSPAVAKTVNLFTADHPGPATYRLESTLHLDWNDSISKLRLSDTGKVTIPPPPAPIAPAQ